MINWRNIEEVGNPTDPHMTYLVTDGKEMATTQIYSSTRFKGGEPPITTFKGWKGDENTQEDNDCCSGPLKLLITPTHWCPTNEINLP